MTLARSCRLQGKKKILLLKEKQNEEVPGFLLDISPLQTVVARSVTLARSYRLQGKKKILLLKEKQNEEVPGFLLNRTLPPEP